MPAYRATHAIVGTLSVLVTAESEERAADAAALFDALDRAGIKCEIEHREFDGAVRVPVSDAAWEEAARRAGYVKNSAGRWEDPAVGEDGVSSAKQLCEMMGIPPVEPERDEIEAGKLAVVDGDENADIYGSAATPEEALALARECFVDEVVRVERYGPIQLRSGGELTEAFVAITSGGE